MTNPKTNRETVISKEELNSMKEVAKEFSEYESKRALALLSLFSLGKRREEVAQLKVENIIVNPPNLNIIFFVMKKRKDKSLITRREKQIDVESENAKFILSYLDWLKKNQPSCVYLFPSRKSVFGEGFRFYHNKHLSGSQLWRIIKSLSPDVWCHLFRETAGAEVVKEDSSLMGVYKVMLRLDLERETTAWNYVKRYAIDKIKQE